MEKTEREKTQTRHAIEAKWRERWDERGAHVVDLDADVAERCYCLVMFSYPSANRLHLGHWFNYGPTDSWARFRRMQGAVVFQPMGFDSFGLPAENYAIKQGGNPRVHTEENVRAIREQLKIIGAMYDWGKEVCTHDPSYYKHTQELFLTLFEAGQAYKAKASVNWCESCQTVLANEQVVGGACERCDGVVRQRSLSQWFFRITDYADELLEGLERIDWPASTVHVQRNWIGKSSGARVRFAVEGRDETLGVFTTRPDTLFGVTYMVLAPEHPLVDAITAPDRARAVAEYKEAATLLNEIERSSTVREKTGVFTGAYALHPLTGERLPVWIGDHVLAHYGTGAVMAVPGHDQRDFDFAREFELPITRVVRRADQAADAPLEAAEPEPGIACNSGPFDGLPTAEASDAIVAALAEKGRGEAATTYRLRDWLVSRQRYWGAPIPIVHCPRCGQVPVPRAELPVRLPEDAEFQPTGESPLKRHPTWRFVACPSCGGDAERDTDTMDTFVDSSWYFLRYLSPDKEDGPFDAERVARWLPVDLYVGGREHAAMHLLYARYVTKVLHRLGRLPFDEPFTRLVHQGVITHMGARMSKSRGNVVNAEEYLERFGSDTLRAYLMFGFTYAEGGDWDSTGIEAMDRYLAKVHGMLRENAPRLAEASGDDAQRFAALNLRRHETVRAMTIDLERLHFNTAIARHMELTRDLGAALRSDPAGWGDTLVSVVDDWIRLFAPIAPHLGEELWELSGHAASVFDEAWPTADRALLDAQQVTIVVQVNGKVRGELRVPPSHAEEWLREEARALPGVQAHLAKGALRKVVVVPGRLVNFVVA